MNTQHHPQALDSAASADVTPTNRRASKPHKTWFHIMMAMLGLVITLVLVNMSIYRYETHMATGEKLLLALAPVDPRSLMQGDYMTLRYAIADEIMERLLAEERSVLEVEWDGRGYRYDISIDGTAIVKKDSHDLGHLVRILDSDEALSELTLAPNEMPLQFRVRKGQVKVATNAFFFQEGDGEAYAVAKYGLFRVNKEGQPLLTHMVNEAFEVIKPE